MNFHDFSQKPPARGAPHFAKNRTIWNKSALIQLFCKETPRLGFTTCNHSENQSFGADDRKETKIEVRTNTNGPKLEQKRCHFGAKWSTFWRKLVQKWGSPLRRLDIRIPADPAPRAWSFDARGYPGFPSPPTPMICMRLYR